MFLTCLSLRTKYHLLRRRRPYFAPQPQTYISDSVLPFRSQSFSISRPSIFTVDFTFIFFIPLSFYTYSLPLLIHTSGRSVIIYPQSSGVRFRFRQVQALRVSMKIFLSCRKSISTDKLDPKQRHSSEADKKLTFFPKSVI